MKRLTITYNSLTLYDGDVDEIMWNENESGVRVEGRRKPVSAPSAGGGLLDLLTNASKAKTQQVIEEKRKAPVERVVGESVIEIGADDKAVT